MRVFAKPNLSNGWKCPICKTSEEKEVVLIGVEGTQEGNNMQAEQFHLDCLELTYYPVYRNSRLITMVF
jgi:hypothetical protein